MNYQGLHISVVDESFWGKLPAIEHNEAGNSFRRLSPDNKHSLRLPAAGATRLVAVLSLASPPKRSPAKEWRILLGNTPVAIHHRKTFPKHLLLDLPPSCSSDGKELILEPLGAANSRNDLLIEGVTLMARTGRFSELWTSPWRAIKKLLTGRVPEWAPQDFPYSHFDGLGYLLQYDEVRQAVFSRKYDTAFRFWYKKGRHLGHPLPLATNREPLPGTPFNLVMHYKGEYNFHPTSESATSNFRTLSDLKQENEMLIAQLHEVQTELEKYFLKNLQATGR